MNIVGFFDVHGSDVEDPLRCGDLNMNGVQNVLAFYYAVNEVNRNINHYFRPEVKLGMSFRKKKSEFYFLMF